MHTSTYTVLYDPDGLIEAELPPQRAPYECLVTAVLAWTDTTELRKRDLEQIALQLTGHARAVAADVQRRSVALAESDRTRVLTDVVLAEAGRCLSARPRGTVTCCKNRARLVRELYERLDRLKTPPHPEPPSAPPA